MSKTIEITLAQPIDGEGVEKIDMDKYTAEVLAYVKKIHSDAEVTISWVSNDGTAETNIFAEDENGYGHGSEFQTDVEETVMLAEEQAFCNGDNYAE